MSITYPPEMLPVADEPADVILHDEDGSVWVIGRKSKRKREGDQVPGMPGAICHACGLGYRCSDEDCPNDTPSPCKKAQEHLSTSGERREMDDAQIKRMADRFLSWKLPKNFNPDGGISFEPAGNKGTPHEYAHEPSGTNLFDANQAEAMVRHMIDGLPKSES